MKCYLCPRRCGADRAKGEVGFCGEGEKFKISKVMLHRGEEPIFGGEKGCGAIFFGGCNLGCVYCQNREISRGGLGRVVEDAEVERAVFSLVEKGAAAIEFVTAAHFSDRLAALLGRIKPRLSLPIVYNSGGYETLEALRRLDGLIDVYLPDFKYAGARLAARYSQAADYPDAARAAIGEMCRQRGAAVIENGLIKSGVVIRHLVLPGSRRDSIEVIRTIAREFPTALVSVMRQYTPGFDTSGDRALARRVTSFEYDSVVKEAASLGLRGFMQEKNCSTAEMTPDFSEVYDDSAGSFSESFSDSAEPSAPHEKPFSKDK